MFSLQTIFGKGDKFFDLLESSAGSACSSAKALIELLSVPATQQSMEKLKQVRRHEKELYTQISKELVNTFVTVLDREDIEALNNALYKIPKVVEKFAERYKLAMVRIGEVDFISRAVMLNQACEVLEQMVGQLRKGMDLDEVKKLNDQLQSIEAEADREILELYRDVYVNETDPIRYLVKMDLFEILEKAIDRCRNVGNVIYHIVLKNS